MFRIINIDELVKSQKAPIIVIPVLESKIEAEKLITPLPPLSQEIIQIAREHGKVTVRDVRSITGANRNTIKVHIKELVRVGQLKMVGKGKGTWYKLS